MCCVERSSHLVDTVWPQTEKSLFLFLTPVLQEFISTIEQLLPGQGIVLCCGAAMKQLGPQNGVGQACKATRPPAFAIWLPCEDWHQMPMLIHRKRSKQQKTFALGLLAWAIDTLGNWRNWYTVSAQAHWCSTVDKSRTAWFCSILHCEPFCSRSWLQIRWLTEFCRQWETLVWTILYPWSPFVCCRSFQ